MSNNFWLYKIIWLYYLWFIFGSSVFGDNAWCTPGLVSVCRSLASSAVAVQANAQVAISVALGADVLRSLSCKGCWSTLPPVPLVCCKLTSPCFCICDALAYGLTSGITILGLSLPAFCRDATGFQISLADVLQSIHLVPMASCPYRMSFSSVPSSMR